MVEKAVNKILTDDLPRMLTVYNVAEWAEGGPGLQPNKKDGFGYLKETLDVVRNLPIVESVSQ